MKHWLAILLFTAVCSAHGESLTQALQQCAKLQDDAQRLSCMDRVAQSVKATSVEAKAVPVDSPVKAEIAVPEPVATASPVVAENDADIAKFGAAHLEKPKPEDELQEVMLTVTQAHSNKIGKWRVSFSNGQQWQQTDSSYAKLAAGDQVVIKKGVLGVFYLFKQGSHRKIAVKRIK